MPQHTVSMRLIKKSRTDPKASKLNRKRNLKPKWCKHLTSFVLEFQYRNKNLNLKYLIVNRIFQPHFFYLLPLCIKINLPKFHFIESLHHTAILKNLNFCANPARSKTWSRRNISWTEIKSLLTEPSNVLPFYTSSQNSNLLYSEVDSLKRS